MKGWKFDELVKQRANEITQKRIADFKRKIIDAVKELSNDGWSDNYPGINFRYELGTNGRTCLENILSEKTNNWPKELWEVDRQKVAQEIMDLLSPMEKALQSLNRVPAEGEVPMPEEMEKMEKAEDKEPKKE